MSTGWPRQIDVTSPGLGVRVAAIAAALTPRSPSVVHRQKMVIAPDDVGPPQSLSVTDLDAILARQDGLIRQDQLGDAGVTRAAARWRLDTGRWRALLPAVFLTVTGEPTARQRLVAACLYAGPQAQLTGVAALRLHGLRELPEETWIRGLVPHARQVASVEFVRVHRTRRLDRNARALDTGGGWPGLGEVCAVPRALAD